MRPLQFPWTCSKGNKGPMWGTCRGENTGDRLSEYGVEQGKCRAVHALREPMHLQPSACPAAPSPSLDRPPPVTSPPSHSPQAHTATALPRKALLCEKKLKKLKKSKKKSPPKKSAPTPPPGGGGGVAPRAPGVGRGLGGGSLIPDPGSKSSV